MLLLGCQGLTGQFGLIEEKNIGAVQGLSMTLIRLLLQWLCLISRLDNMNAGCSIGRLYVGVVGDVAERSNSRAPP